MIGGFSRFDSQTDSHRLQNTCSHTQFSYMHSIPVMRNLVYFGRVNVN